MNCIDRLISISDPCGAKEVSITGLDITDIASFDWSILGVQASKKYMDSVTYLRKQRTRSANNIKDTILSLVQQGSKLEITSKVEPQPYTAPSYTGNYIASFGNYPNKGVFISKQDNTGHCFMKSLKLYEIRYIPKGTGTFQLFYTNGITQYQLSVTIDPADVDVEQIIQLEEPIYGHKGFISAWTDGAVQLQATDVQCGCSGQPFIQSCYKSQGYDYPSNMQTSAMAYGLKLGITCACDFDGFICALATQHKGLMGEIILKSLEYSIMYDSLNSTSLININTDSNKLNDIKNDMDIAYSRLIPLAEQILKSGNYKDCVQCKGLSIGLMN